jgi:hypothetical protein
MKLGAMFEAEGLVRQALEQFVLAADLGDGCASAPLRAARLLSEDRQYSAAAAMAEQALAIEPDLKEAADYAIQPRERSTRVDRTGPGPWRRTA